MAETQERHQCSSSLKWNDNCHSDETCKTREIRNSPPSPPLPKTKILQIFVLLVTKNEQIQVPPLDGTSQSDGPRESRNAIFASKDVAINVFGIRNKAEIWNIPAKI
jgi:hypothetical protein